MREKKIRGMKRKTNTLIKRIEEHTKTFPSIFYNDEYWNMLLPVSQTFIDSRKTPRQSKAIMYSNLIKSSKSFNKYETERYTYISSCCFNFYK
ncbi:DUF3916 domain-containing protein [Bacillus thuringiensis]|nr:DUF3916 domain-containing protein [Bacillus thuringiensis]MEC2564755.1 DUF3916 domain-containing protein [Bacillus thuringiensis]